MLDKFNNFTNKILQIATIILFAAIFLFMNIGIIFRLIGSPLFWPDELCRYLFIWAVLIQVVILVNKKQHISIDWFIGFFPEKYKIIFSKIVLVIQLIFVTTLVYYGAKMMILTYDIQTTSLKISWSIIYLSIVITSILMFISFLLQIFNSNH